MNIKRFDLFQKGPRDLSEPTLSGAVVSCCTVALALYLFTSEFWLFMDRRWESEIFIDDTRMEEKLQIDLNITLPALPCELLSYDGSGHDGQPRGGRSR